MSVAASFTINGRFLSQNPTGVQRYALHVVKAIDQALAARSNSAVLLAPKETPSPGLQTIGFAGKGHLRGHAWEQISLPRLVPGRLLNLCNSAPVSKSDQIVCIHDANIFTAPESYSFSFRSLYHALQPRLAKNAARICTVSHAAARQIARFLPVRPEDIAILPNGHEHALSWDPLAAVVVRPVVDAIEMRQRSFVLVIGSRAQHKNLALIKTIADSLDALKIDIVVAGGGANIFAAETLQGKSNIHMVGRVSDHDLAYLIDRALCLVFPSFTEGFGLPIVEAMARGCPVVSSDCASMPEVCGSAALLASPFDPAKWIAHIKELKLSRQLGEDLIGRGYDQIQNFSWSKTAQGYLDLLEEPARHVRTTPPRISVTPNITVAIATRGRPSIVEATVRHLLMNQTLKPDRLIVSCADALDAGSLAEDPDVEVLTGPPGLAAQRNTILRNLAQGTDIVVFFDDDFLADSNWLANIAEVFRDESRVVGLTGRVVADGIKGPGLQLPEALRLLSDAEPDKHSWLEPFSPYGCNMAYRVNAIGDLKFDERLVLYGWLEDRDFGAALASNGGRLAKSSKPFGVHMGTKSGRGSGDRLGYSQVVNPLYMVRKGTMTLSAAVDHITRNMASNFGKAAWPEPYIDRRGRVRGNLLAIADVLQGRLQPERAATLGIARNTVLQPQTGEK